MSFKRVVAVGAGVALLLVGAVPAWGHAGFEQGVLPPDSDQELTLDVPIEREDVTNDRVTVSIPGEFSLRACSVAEGWACSATPGHDGDASTVVFSRVSPAEDEEAAHDEQAEGTAQTLRPADAGHDTPEAAAGPDILRFSVHTPGTAGDYSFPVEQRYSDGKKARWDGAADSDRPSPVVSVGPAA